MTIGQKLHMTLSNIESAKANLEQFGLDTQDQTAQAQYFEMAEELGNLAERFKGRINYAESQEPQYKVKQQAMSPEQGRS